VINVEDDQVFNVFYAYLLLVYPDVKDGRQSESTIFLAKNIQRADLSIDKFVAELAEEQLRIFFSQVMEMLANLGIQANPQVVINCELSILLT